jgi:hypothetical protein
MQNEINLSDPKQRPGCDQPLEMRLHLTATETAANLAFRRPIRAEEEFDTFLF